MKKPFTVFLVGLAATCSCFAQGAFKSGGFAPSGAFQLHTDGGPMEVESSTNLSAWTPQVSGRGTLLDASSTNAEWRFYRAKSGNAFVSNIVGFVRVPIQQNKMVLVASPFTEPLRLDQPNVRTAVFGSANPPVQVSMMQNGKLTAYTFDDLDNNWSPAIPVIAPGTAFFVRGGVKGGMNVTFSGELPQGTIKRAIPQGETIFAPLVPRPGPVQDALGALPIDGAQIQVWNEQNQAYQTSTFDKQMNRWVPSLSYKPGRGVSVKFPEPMFQTTLSITDKAAK